MSTPRPSSLVFTFPGQGSYRYGVLRELFTDFPETAPHFARADAVARRFLGHAFLPLAEAETQDAHDRYLARCPDLDQLGIYLTEVLLAALTRRQGLGPDLLAGHSFGDLAALAVAGAYPVETGLKIVAQRVLALRGVETEGRMAALSCSPERAQALLAEAGAGRIEVSVVNYPKQTVVSGPPERLEALRAVAARQGVMVTLLQSRYPFHSSYLAGAVAPFRTALYAHDFRAARTPVLLSTEQRRYAPGDDLAALLAAQFTTPLDFQALVRSLYDQGYRTFVECGAGDIVTKLVRRNLLDTQDLTLVATGAGTVREGLAEAARLAGQTGTAVSVPAAAVPAVPMQQAVATLLADLSGLAQSLSKMIEQATGLLEQVAEAAKGIPVEAVPVEAPLFPEAEPGEAAPLVEPPQAVPAYGAPMQHAAPEPAAALEAAAAPRTFPEEVVPAVPIAIVSMGCVLPGAADPDAYWRNIRDGVSGIVDLAALDPDAGRDFVAGAADAIVPDKTYTLLNGAIRAVPYDAALLGRVFTEDEFAALTRGQKLLALATAQTLAGLAGGSGVDTGRLRYLLGATADGASEYDDALFAESLHRHLATLDEPEAVRRAFAESLERLTGYRAGDAARLTQHRLYTAVADRMLGAGVATAVVDTACSSSLYSIDLGVKALRNGEADLVLAGGVFAPGPANNALFAQFRGLTPTGSCPLDAAADGVVFGDGAALVALKRLPDALRDGDRVHAVLRGTGLSSDGKSPAINVPQSAGQALAMKKAYAAAHVPVDTIQYLEAHATSTPVGDAVELASLAQAMEGRDPALPRVHVGSVKALIGHTGWVSGVASILKICKAFEAGEIPRQYHYDAPNPKVDLGATPFTVARAAEPWPENVGGYPRRAGINGFGFGGTNAHVVLEAFDAEYHRHLCERLPEALPAPALALVAAGPLFPAEDALAAPQPNGRVRFDRAKLRLPAKTLLLPDVTDAMDPSQYLAALAAEQILEALPPDWVQAHRARIGVVLGLASKTECGVRANERIFLDRLRRLVDEGADRLAMPPEEARRVADRLAAAIRAEVPPSGPYTLPGLMPNVAAGRVTHLFNLKGPNVVVDRGEDSLFQALDAAAQFLRHGDCDLVMAGALHAAADEAHEAACLLALTTLDTARRDGLPVLATVALGEPGGAAAAVDAAGRQYGGAQGAAALAEALRAVRERRARVAVCAPGGAPCLVLAPEGEPSLPALPAEPPPVHRAPEEPSGTHAYVQGTPIYTFTPALVAEEAEAAPAALDGRRLLVLTDQPDVWRGVAAAGVLEALSCTVAGPTGIGLDGALAIDLTDDATAAASVRALEDADFDAILIVKDLAGHTEAALLENDFGTERTLLDLAFTVCRHAYEALAAGAVDVAVLNLNAYTGEALAPATGLTAGFAKSLGRELPEATVRIVNTDEGHLLRALRQVETELGQPGATAEVCYRQGRRHTVKLRPLARLTKQDRPFLTRDSVVLATGGGRGVTAVLAEELLRRYGCTVVAVGRTDPEAAPEAVRTMSEAAFKDYEAAFYREALARDPAQKITDLKRRYGRYQAVNELCQVIRRLQGLPGRFVYRSADLNDPAALDALVDSVHREYGRIDFVVHGAGIQDSRVLPKKSLALFRRIVDTKLGSLNQLYRACIARRNGSPVHFHILTSAFSFMGNDGQPDYGAANEAMNRLAAAMGAREPDVHWSSLAWLGWAGIGMTRGSEFAALAANRRLRGVTREEGQEIFASLLGGPVAAPVNVLMADGELAFYDVPITAAASPILEAPGTALPPDGLAIQTSNGSPPAESLPDEPPEAAGAGVLVAPKTRTAQRTALGFTVETAPFLWDHQVNGVPTLPGAFLIALVAEAAQQLRPGRRITAFEDTHFKRFVRVYPERGTDVRLDACIVGEDARESRVHVRVLTDFHHASGRLLQKDVVLTELHVRMATTAPPAEARRVEAGGMPQGRYLPDPYVMPASPVQLGGAFRSLRQLVVDGTHRRARYRLSARRYAPSPYDHLLPNAILVDAFWRFGTVQPQPDRSLSVYVPEKCRVMEVFFDYADFGQALLREAVVFSGVNPREDGAQLHVGPIEAADASGRLLLRVEGGLCRKFGDVPHAY
ncbi:MAG: SDR family NAD(P)-dependent oxidoreductase [Rhodothermales bacterium]|nr:SDR family NAD(P)-dependent oxidoreductase [Rhodothermales bacterium]